MFIAAARDASTTLRSHQLRSIERPGSTFVVGSYTWKAVSDRDTLEDLSQSPRSPFEHDCKLLILNGEMSEWSIEHAWKAKRATDISPLRSTLTHTRFAV